MVSQEISQNTCLDAHYPKQAAQRNGRHVLLELHVEMTQHGGFGLGVTE